MFRKIAASFLVVLLLGACVFFYLKLRKAREPVPNAITAIPEDAAFIVEMRQTQSLFHTVDGTNMIWQDLRALPSFASFRNTLYELDSLLAVNENLVHVTEGNPLFFSAHPADNGLEFLCAFSVPENSSASRLNSFLSSVYTVRAKENGISSVSSASRSEICFFSISKGILLLSQSETLLAKAIEQSKAAKSILNETAFQKVYGTAKSSRFDMRLFLHFPQQAFWPKSFLDPAFSAGLAAQGAFAQWMALDCSIRPQALLLNGFCSANAETDYLNLFHDQEAQQTEITKVMPASATSFLHFGFSNFQNWYEAYDKKRAAHARASIDSINSRYGTDIGALFSSWVETETGILLSEGEPEDSTASEFVILRSEHIDASYKALNELCALVCRKDSLKNDTTHFRKHIISHLPVKGILPLLFGSSYAVRNNYYTSVENCLVFSNTLSGLKHYLRQVDSDHTLYKDKHYSKFSGNLASKSNVYLYSNIARSGSAYPAFSSPSLGAAFKKQTDLLLRFDAFGIQFTSKGDLFYSTACLEENPVYKKEVSALWETRLDTVFNFRPQLLVNHLNNTLDIFVQDEGNKIYLLSNTGAVLWTKILPEKINGEVYQVDAFKNNKLQILFSCHSHIYLLDRNGKDLDGFPLTLPAPATNALAVMDYDRKNDYRLLITCADKHIRNYTIKGKAVEGWNDPVLTDTAMADILHTRMGGKDYLLTADIQGQISMFDRHGEMQAPFKEKLPSPLLSLYLTTGKDPAHTFIVACDSMGNIVRTSISGKTQHMPFKKFNGKPFFLFEDLNGDRNPEYIFLDGNELSVFTEDKSLLFGYQFSDSTGLTPFFVPGPEGIGWIGVASESASELYLLNSGGTQPQGFPLKGRLPFRVGDLHHNGSLQLVCGEGKNIYVYALP
ncbi:MAG: DUF3352 domain-containing protein [Bacteroidia bacterium]